MRTRHLKNAVHVLLTLQDYTDSQLTALGQSIVKLAPQSQLYQQVPGLQPIVGKIGQQYGMLDGANVAIVKAEAELVGLRETRDVARDQLEKSMTGLRGLVESNAVTVSDANALGLDARIGRPPITPLLPPETVIVRLGKKHGQFIVSAKSSLRQAKFGAQLSTDPIGPATWQDLPGSGKQRTVKGHASGTVLWVRFRTLRGAVQSDWCAPVSVVVP
jgi:hypothetical protein